MAVVVIGMVVTGCRSPSTDDETVAAEQVLIGGVLWYVDYDAALEIARREDKALWVHFGENPG